MSDGVLTHERIKEVLRYDPDTGLFHWNIRRGRCAAGEIAGTPQSKGYLSIRVDTKRYLSHRLAWFYMTGKWPVDQVDHINGERTDNRFVNLRDVTAQANQQNQRHAQTGNTSNFLGVSFYKAYGKYKAEISRAGVYKFLGYFITPEAAHAAYLTAKRELHEGCTI